ncbi:AAA family ATPase [Rahnella aceris]|uniref:AAA family ATPase n=1 Tax=Rahnella sp. (strain Y9602) TaxID=2703885 RepID=UPI001C2625FE|nr:AAA family ATPase [Rahnella aceris]MBU9838419.1 AAA family ATPase [Rahnella aceris]
MSIESVVGWANSLKRNLWWLHAIRLAAEKGELDRDDFELLFTVAKMEHGLEAPSESYADYIAPLNLAGFGEEKNAVNLKSISKVNNVSALVSNASLEFAITGLTAVYGDNGSGKSSYAKILKNACLTRGDTPKILSNIYEEVSGEPAAEIAIVIGQEQHDINWELSNVALEELKSIRIFDNTSANHYISGEDIIEYKPAGMKLLSQLMLACEFVRTNIEKEKQPYAIAGPLPIFRSGSKTLVFVSGLSDKTKDADVDVLCISKEIEEFIPVHNTELAKLKTSTPEQIRKSYSDRCKSLQPLLDHLTRLQSKLDQESIKSIKNSYDDYKGKQAAAELARTQALDGHELLGICSPQWILMWSHVKSFIETYNTGVAFPPIEGAPCPACLQPVSKDAANKLKSFNDYLQNQTQVEANKAKKIFDTYINNLKLLTFDLKPYEFALSMIREQYPLYADEIIALNSALETLRNNIIKLEPNFEIIQVQFNSVVWISAQIDSWKKKEAAVATNEGLAKQVAELTVLIQDLEDRKLFTSAKKNILAEITRHKKLKLYSNLFSSCQSTPITALTSTIARSGSIGHLQNAFRDELKKFGFENLDVGTVTRGLRGKQMLRLNLTGKENGIVEVASEGEQKCVALASFLAELTVDDRKSAIIFDDPINSLDHKWRRKFSERIVKESLTRQVIVFTHDMPFLKMLEEASEEIDSKLNLISIAKYGNKAGFPFPEPPWDAKNTVSRIGFLKNLLPALKKRETSGDPEYEFHAKHTYNLMRETWERLVEEWLLRKVVERFAREVKTQSLKAIINNITSEDDERINAAMSKCSTFMYGHDNATGLAVDCPCYNEIEQDVANLDTYFKELKKRRT